MKHIRHHKLLYSLREIFPNMSRVQLKDDGGETLEFLDMGTIVTPKLAPMKTDEEVAEIFAELPDFICRDDDVMLCTFAKTGTFFSIDNNITGYLLVVASEDCLSQNSYRNFTSVR